MCTALLVHSDFLGGFVLCMASALPNDDLSDMSGHSSITLSTAAAAAASADTVQARCCDCSFRNGCDAKCACVRSERICTSCLPDVKRCENRKTEYQLGKGVPRSLTAALDAASSAGNSAAASGQPPASHIWQKPKRSPLRNKQSATVSQPAAAAAVVPRNRSITAREPACIEQTLQMCAQIRSGAAAGGYILSEQQLLSIEQLVEEARGMHAGALDLQLQYKEAMKQAAADKAALVSSTKKVETATKKFNEAEAKLKILQANSSKVAAATISPSKKRSRQEHQSANTESLQAGDALAAPASTGGSVHVSKKANVHPQRQQHNSVLAAAAAQSATIFHSSPVSVLIRRPAPVAPTPGSALERSPSGKIRYEADKCLVVSGMNMRSHILAPDALQTIKQTLVNLGLCREEDAGQCTPQDVYKIQQPPQAAPGPIKWKVVFRTAQAAEVVLERYMNAKTQDSQSLRGIDLRAFVDRQQLAQAAEAEEPVWMPQRPQRQSSAVTEVLARTQSSDSVIVLEPPAQPESKIELPAGGRVQFVTRHAAAQAQVPSVPLIPEPRPTVAVPTPEPQQLTLQAQQPAFRTHPPTHEASPVMNGGHAHGWMPYPPPPRPLVPMMHAYHGGHLPHGMYMQHPGGSYPYGAPTGYAPAGYMPAPMPYPHYPPQF